MTNAEVKKNWPDDVRLKMIEKSEFYAEPRVYQYGYYDGYQHAIKKLAEANKGYNPAAIDECVKALEGLLKSLTKKGGIAYNDPTYKQIESALSSALLKNDGQ